MRAYLFILVSLLSYIPVVSADPWQEKRPARHADIGKVESPIKATPADPSFLNPQEEVPVITDIVPGTGKEAVVGLSALVRRSIWIQDPSASDMKGKLLPDSGQLFAYQLVQGPSPSTVQKTTDAIVGMKVGGKRSVVAMRLLTEVELVDVAPTSQEFTVKEKFTPVQPMNGPAENGYVPMHPQQTVQALSETKIKDGWKEMHDGIQYKDVTEGTGEIAANDKMVKLEYALWGYSPDDLEGKRKDARDNKFRILRTVVTRDSLKIARERKAKGDSNVTGFTVQVSAMVSGMEGMKVGGRRIISFDNFYEPQTVEMRLLDVASSNAEIMSREPAQPGQVINLSYSPRNDEAMKKADEAEKARQTAAEEAFRARASTAYPALIASARQKNKADPIMLGIIMGEQWHGVQDVNDCRVTGWEKRSNIPFCLYDAPTDEDLKAPTWTTCVKVNEDKFDTSWIRSAYGDSEPPDDSLGTALVYLIAGLDEAKECNVEVSVLSDNTVGRVMIITSLQGSDVEKIVKQLKDKYGESPKYDESKWAGDHKSGRLTWDLSGLYVEYTEQGQTVGGDSFNGGVLEVYTQAWKDHKAEEERKNYKPAF